MLSLGLLSDARRCNALASAELSRGLPSSKSVGVHLTRSISWVQVTASCSRMFKVSSFATVVHLGPSCRVRQPGLPTHYGSDTPHVQPTTVISRLMVLELPSSRQNGTLHGTVKSGLVTVMSDIFSQRRTGEQAAKCKRVAEATASTALSGTYSLCAQLSTSFSSIAA